MRGRNARRCVLERKPRKEFSRDKRLRGGSEKAPSGHSGKNDYTKLEKLWYARRERKGEGRERDVYSSGDEAAVSRDVTVACSFILEPFPLGYFHNVKLLVKPWVGIRLQVLEQFCLNFLADME